MKKLNSFLIGLMLLNTLAAIAQNKKPIHKQAVVNEADKINAIKKWILGKLAANCGHSSDDFRVDTSENFSTTYSKTLLDEDNTNGTSITINTIITFTDVTNKNYEKKVSSSKYSMLSTLKWRSIQEVKFECQPDTILKDPKKHSIFHSEKSSFITFYGDIEYSLKITNNGVDRQYVQGENAEMDKRNKSKAIFYLDNAEPNLGSRLVKAFNDLITYYKKSKPNELY